LFGGFFSDHYGPLRAIGVSNLLAFISSIILAIQKNLVVFIIFRIIYGIGIGCMSSISPVYVGG
jgi:MFS family permease